MYKIVFFQKDEDNKVLPIKVLCSKTDTENMVGEKALLILSDILEDESEILDYNIKEIKNLTD